MILEETDYHQFKSDARWNEEMGPNAWNEMMDRFWELQSVKEKHVSSLNFGVSGKVGKLITKNAKINLQKIAELMG